MYETYKHISSSSLLKLSVWIYVSYSFLILTYLFSGIYYNVGSVLRILPYLLLCLSLLIIGENIGILSNLKSFRGHISTKLSKLGYVSVVGAILLVYDLLRLNKINFGLRIVDQQVSVFGIFGNVLASLGIIVWLNSLYQFRIHKKRIPLISYLSLLSYVSGGILSAGRQSLILIVISSVILLLWCQKEKSRVTPFRNITYIKKKQPWLLYSIVSLVFAYFIFISNYRSGISEISFKIETLEKNFNAKTSAQTVNLSKSIGPLSDIYIEFLYYYTHELVRLDLFYQNYEYPPLIGLSQLSYIERRLHWLIGNQGEKSWDEVVRALEKKAKFSSHTWGTFITNFIMDFGRLGTLCVCFLFGLFFGILFKDLKEKATSFSVVRLSILCAGVVFSIQFSPFNELTYTVPAILSSFIVIEPKV